MRQDSNINIELNKRFLEKNQEGSLPVEFCARNGGQPACSFDENDQISVKKHKAFASLNEKYKHEQSKHLEFVCTISNFLGVSLTANTVASN